MLESGEEHHHQGVVGSTRHGGTVRHRPQGHFSAHPRPSGRRLACPVHHLAILPIGGDAAASGELTAPNVMLSVDATLNGAHSPRARLEIVLRPGRIDVCFVRTRLKRQTLTLQTLPLRVTTALTISRLDAVQ